MIATREHRRAFRAAGVAAALTAALSAGGCLDSAPLRPGEMDAAWQLTESVWDRSEPATEGPDTGPPYRYVIAYEPSVVWSVIELYRSAVELPEIHDVVRFPVSDEHARAAAELMRSMAVEMRQLSEAFEGVDASERAQRKWAAATARLAHRVHTLLASMSPDPDVRRDAELDEAAAWVVMPLLQMLAASFAEGQTPASEAELAARLAQAEEVLTAMILNSAFRMTGRPIRQDLLDDVLQVQRTQRGDGAIANTTDVLLWYRQVIPQEYDVLPQMPQDAAVAAGHLADGLEYLADLSAQWPRVNYIAFEMRRHEGQRVFAAEFDIREGERVVLKDLDTFAPEVVFTGHGRVVVQRATGEPSGPERHEVLAVLFQSDREGGITLNFDGIVYALVRLFAFPLRDATLEEVRYTSRIRPDEHARLFEMLMRRTGGAGDGRQIIRVETVSRPVFEPRADLPPRLLGRDQTIEFRFLAEGRAWRYTRESFQKPELWLGPAE